MGGGVTSGVVANCQNTRGIDQDRAQTDTTRWSKKASISCARQTENEFTPQHTHHDRIFSHKYCKHSPWRFVAFAGCTKQGGKAESVNGCQRQRIQIVRGRGHLVARQRHHAQVGFCARTPHRVVHRLPDMKAFYICGHCVSVAVSAQDAGDEDTIVTIKSAAKLMGTSCQRRHAKCRIHTKITLSGRIVQM